MGDEKKPGDERPESNLNIGLGGLFKGLGDMLGLLSRMADQIPGETGKSGEFEVKGSGMRGVYGFTVRTGIGGLPRVERFGNIRTGESGPEVAEVREPLVDVFDEESEVVVIAEVPGVEEREITIELHGDVLVIESRGERRYAREVLLPAAIEPASLQQRYHNGIIELRLKKLKE